MRRALKVIFELALIAAAGTGSYFYIKAHLHSVKPCETIIPYAIDSFDPKFGISRSDFESAISEAAGIWEKAAGKKLFSYTDPDSTAKDVLDINLIYDYRQEAIDRLGKLGITIGSTRSSYDLLKSRYESLKAAHDQEKADIASKSAALEQDMAAYNQEVDRWNKRGGATGEQYSALNQEKQPLNARTAALNSEISSFNNDVATLNAFGTELNKLASSLNLDVKSYNTIGATTGSEFDEGLYVQDAAGRHIDIYEFEDKGQLRRVLAHELGHALGLDHVDDPQAIMYRVNQSTNEWPTAADFVDLDTACGIPAK